MTDEAAKAVIRRFFGDRVAPPPPPRAPIEHYLQYRQLTPDGWQNLLRAKQKHEIKAYREAMQQIGRDLGLE